MRLWSYSLSPLSLSSPSLSSLLSLPSFLFLLSLCFYLPHSLIHQPQMGLYNVIHAKGLEEEVSRRISVYEKKLLTLGWRVIQEFGYEPIVEQFVTSQGYSKSRAVLQVVSDHAPIQEEVSVARVLLVFFSCVCIPLLLSLRSFRSLFSTLLYSPPSLLLPLCSSLLSFDLFSFSSFSIPFFLFHRLLAWPYWSKWTKPNFV